MVAPTYASRPEVSLESRSPREYPLGFVAIEVFLRRYTELLPEVSPVFACSNYSGRSLPRTVVVRRSLWNCVPPVSSVSCLLSSRSSALYRATTRGLSSICLQTIAGEAPYTLVFQRSLWTRAPPVSSLSGLLPSNYLRPSVGCCFCNLFDAHGRCVCDKRGARSLIIRSCRQPICDADK